MFAFTATGCVMVLCLPVSIVLTSGTRIGYWFQLIGYFAIGYFVTRVVTGVVVYIKSARISAPRSCSDVNNMGLLRFQCAAIPVVMEETVYSRWQFLLPRHHGFVIMTFIGTKLGLVRNVVLSIAEDPPV